MALRRRAGRIQAAASVGLACALGGLLAACVAPARADATVLLNALLEAVNAGHPEAAATLFTDDSLIDDRGISLSGNIWKGQDGARNWANRVSAYRAELLSVESHPQSRATFVIHWSTVLGSPAGTVAGELTVREGNWGRSQSEVLRHQPDRVWQIALKKECTSCVDRLT